MSKLSMHLVCVSHDDCDHECAHDGGHDHARDQYHRVGNTQGDYRRDIMFDVYGNVLWAGYVACMEPCTIYIIRLHTAAHLRFFYDC